MFEGDFETQLQALRERYARHLPDTLEEIKQIAFSVPMSDDPRAALQLLLHPLHKLAGAASTFGFPVLGDQALALEQQIKAWLKSPPDPGSPLWETLSSGVRELDGGRGRAASSDLVVLGGGSRPKRRLRSRVAIIEDDPELGAELVLTLRHFGYAATLYPGLEVAETLLPHAVPDALVVDVLFPDEQRDGVAMVEALKPYLPSDVPILYISIRNSYDTLLAAARSGGVGYFNKPLNIPRLIDRLDTLLQPQPYEPYRIMIVDDDQALATHIALVLESSGMQVRLVHQPRQLLDTLSAFQPELILMDVYMPECSGIDLVRMIRLQDDWLSVPVVYLSSEQDIDTQLEAMSKGGDDFLTKPITDRHLLSAVRVRVARARQLSELLARDGLTGLLTHARIKEQLKIEMARARREKIPLTLAMLDLDNFKSVNDRYGHGAGDQVIKACAHLLRQRLRQSDSIGRYGGEEFIAIMPDCTTEAAEQVLEDIRLRLQTIRFVRDSNEFAVTLSGGLAAFDDFPQPDDLLDAADRALYRAKHAGRNRLGIARSDELQSGGRG